MEVGTLKFAWKIKNFSKIQDEIIYSDVFSLGTYKWMMAAYPKEDNHFSIFLKVADSENLPSGWSRNAKLSCTLIDQIDNNSSFTQDEVSLRKFDEDTFWGFRPFISHKELHDTKNGYLMEDTCIIEAKVTMYEDLSVESSGTRILEANEEDMDAFFDDIHSVIYSTEVMSSDEEARQAMAVIEESLNKVPSDLNNPGMMSQLTCAFDVLSSLDDCSILTSEQKADLVSMKDKFIDLSERAAQAARDKKLFTEKELVKKTLDHKLGRCLIQIEKAKAEKMQCKQNIAILQEKRKEDSTSKQEQMFKQFKELKAELDVLVRNWPIYEARLKAAEEEEKAVGTEWNKMKRLFSSLKKPYYSGILFLSRVKLH